MYFKSGLQYIYFFFDCCHEWILLRKKPRSYFQSGGKAVEYHDKAWQVHNRSFSLAVKEKVS